MKKTTFFSLSRTSLFVATALLTMGSLSAAHQFEWYDGRWAQESSDIAPNPAVTYGKLDNGFRWAVIPNDNPSGRVALRLAVQAGSLMEEPHELGIAHYLEHMAFNGSENFPAGTLVPFFQKNGMNFGGDTNAYTTLGETVYQLNLAKNDSASLTEGLRILRDMADRLTLSKHEVEEERGIILSEKRAGESESTTANREWRDFLYEGSRYTNRTIGTDETINGIDADMMRHFYEKWYVPGRMTLVLSGDLKPADVEKLVKDLFGSMKKKPLPAIPEIGQAKRDGVKFMVQKRPISVTNVTIEIMHPEKPVIDNEARAREFVMTQILQTAVGRRLAQRSETEPGLWSRAFFGDGRLEAYSPSVLLTAMMAGGDWKPALKALEEELLRAERFGLTEEEFTSIVAELDDAFERNVAQQSSWTNDDYADNFVDILIQGGVFTSAEQDLARYRKVVKTLKLEEVNRLLQSAFTETNRRIRVSGPVETTEKEVKAYWDTISKMDVKAPVTVTADPFPYLTLPAAVPSPKLTEVKVDTKAADLTLYKGKLANGTTLVLQPLPFEKGTVSVAFTFGDGMLGVTDEDSTLVREAQNILSYQGLGKYTALEASKLFAGRGLSVAESLSNRQNMIGGSAQSADVDMLLQAVWTQFKDPVLTEVNLERALRSLSESAYFRHHDVEGVLRTKRMHALTGGLNRTKALETEDVEKLTLADMSAYLKDVRTRGERVLLISGDFDREKAALWAARLFGSLEPALSEGREIGKAPSFPRRLDETVTVSEDTTGKAILVMAWEAEPAVNDRKRAAARQLAGVLVDERLRQILREKLAAAYSPFGFYHEQIEHDGFGFLMTEIETKIPRLEEVKTAVDGIVAGLLKDGVDAEELERLKKPLVTEWVTSRKRNGLWQMLLLSDLTSEHPYLEWNELKAANLEAVTPQDVERELKAFFKKPAARLIVKSEK